MVLTLVFEVLNFNSTKRSDKKKKKRGNQKTPLCGSFYLFTYSENIGIICQFQAEICEMLS